MNALERLPTKEILQINESLETLARIMGEEMRDATKDAGGDGKRGRGRRREA
jgi:hypothetical protein